MALNAGYHERGRITLPARQTSTSNQNADGHYDTCEKENCAEYNKHPAEEGWRWLLVVQSGMTT
jgi:hypothetical protein